MGLWILPLICGYPHEPQSLTWEVVNPTGQVVWSLSGVHTPGTWWPPLHPDVCRLIPGMDTWDIDLDSVPIPRLFDEWGPGCGNSVKKCMLRQLDFYVCPKDGRTKQQERQCGGLESLYCKAWGCETTGQVYWEPTSNWDWITVQRNYTPEGHFECLIKPKPGSCRSTTYCLPLNITFTSKGRRLTALTEWVKGRTWGLRYYVSGTDFGFWFTIRLTRTTVPIAVGPNPEIKPRPVETAPRPKTKAPPSQGPQPELSPLPMTSALQPKPLDTGNAPPLFKLIEGAYAALNYTQGGVQSCWLCLSAAPPYYEGIAFNGSLRPVNSTSCDWGGGGINSPCQQSQGMGCVLAHLLPLLSELYVIRQ